MKIAFFMVTQPLPKGTFPPIPWGWGWWLPSSTAKIHIYSLSCWEDGMVRICARGQNIMYSNHNPANRRNSGHALWYICFCCITWATLTNHRWILCLNNLCRLGPVKYMHENLAYLCSPLFGSFILLLSFRSFFTVKIDLPYVCLLVLKLITNRWPWALVLMKLVEPGTALAWGGGIHGNPASGPPPGTVTLKHFSGILTDALLA